MKSGLVTLLLILIIGCEQTKQDSGAAVNKPKIIIDQFITIGEYSARILSSAPDGREKGRIPAATEIKILDSKPVKMGQLTGTWFEVDYHGTSGWVSEFSTTGNIIEKERLSKE